MRLRPRHCSGIDPSNTSFGNSGESAKVLGKRQVTIPARRCFALGISHRVGRAFRERIGGQTEVRYFDLTILNEDVFQLDIFVYNACLRVKIPEALDDLGKDLLDQVQSQPTGL